ncbi:SMI1/KNR4 family protein [Stenotrophomonas forensis]|uniref:SMI1/KNR4 family protein n=1 Tax=Stenotrophomonas forensis TaxID=2871169 RepID=A0ABY7Y3P2_9GAMM|nr:SMI1/KNR4 family protein [Stenotrophomonas sp. DFS-20110405]WDM64590.1 SMI1/KNR4 family protein [Stenotrophomonas sp. DFS-20110405]
MNAPTDRPDMPVSADEWHDLLVQFNRQQLSTLEERLAAPEIEMGLLPFAEQYPESPLAEVARHALTGTIDWCGVPGASEQAIVDAEERLGVRLPRSYREFLKVSNGFLMPGRFIDILLPVELIRPFGQDNEEIVQIRRELVVDPVEEAFQYHLDRAIQVSGTPQMGDDFILLDTHRSTAPNECDAHIYSRVDIDWYASFAHLMAERATFNL